MFSDTNFLSNTSSHAIVIGGSMAGLLACRVLSDYFDHVTLIERDRFPEEPAPRKGVPQSYHLHTLLMQGLIILEELFPGLQDELIAAGASLLDVGEDMAWLSPAGWEVRFPSNIKTLACSRNLLEWSVRRRVATCPKVSFIQKAEVTTLLSNADNTHVVGARIRWRNLPQLDPKSEELLHADLVVDASGRSSKAPLWLTTLGYMPPQETKVNSFLGYASRVYQRLPELHSEWQSLLIYAAPPSITRGGGILPLEGNCWIVSLYGVGGDYPPTDEAGFLEFARSLRNPMLYNAIQEAEPRSPIFGYHPTGNCLRHYERLSYLPEGLVVLGDAACTFNPLYAQGMTTAALGAMTLNQCLLDQPWRRGDGTYTGLTQRFQKKLAKVNAAPWLLATSEDFRVHETEGGTPDWAIRLMHGYMDQVMQLTTEDAKVRFVLLEVLNMLKPPTALFRPSILIQLLRQRFRSTVGLQQKALHGELNDSYSS